MKLLLDEHFSPLVAVQLRERRHDVVAAAETPLLLGSSDADLLEYATRHHRVLVTENVRDFAILARTAAHLGLVFTSHARFPRNVQSIGLVVLALDSFLRQEQGAPPGFVHWLRPATAPSPA